MTNIYDLLFIFLIIHLSCSENPRNHGASKHICLLRNPLLSSTRRVDGYRVAWSRTRTRCRVSVVCNLGKQQRRREQERDIYIGASGNEFSLVSTFGFLGLPYEFRMYAHVEREDQSQLSAHHHLPCISPRFIPEKALIKGATVRPVSVAMKAAAGSPHEIAISRERVYFSSYTIIIDSSLEKIKSCKIQKVLPTFINKETRKFFF